ARCCRLRSLPGLDTLPLVQRPEAPGRQGRHHLDGVRQPAPLLPGGNVIPRATREPRPAALLHREHTPHCTTDATCMLCRRRRPGTPRAAPENIMPGRTCSPSPHWPFFAALAPAAARAAPCALRWGWTGTAAWGSVAPRGGSR